MPTWDCPRTLHTLLGLALHLSFLTYKMGTMVGPSSVLWKTLGLRTSLWYGSAVAKFPPNLIVLPVSPLLLSLPLCSLHSLETIHPPLQQRHRQAHNRKPSLFSHSVPLEGITGRATLCLPVWEESSWKLNRFSCVAELSQGLRYRHLLVFFCLLHCELLESREPVS